MTNKNRILYLHFNKHMKQKDIALSLNVSEPYITKVIKRDKRYHKEKQKRKNKNILKHNKQTQDIIYLKREEERQLNAFVKLQHFQAISELSYEVRTTTDNNKVYKAM